MQQTSIKPCRLCRRASATIKLSRYNIHEESTIASQECSLHIPIHGKHIIISLRHRVSQTHGRTCSPVQQLVTQCVPVWITSQCPSAALRTSCCTACSWHGWCTCHGGIPSTTACGRGWEAVAPCIKDTIKGLPGRTCKDNHNTVFGYVYTRQSSCKLLQGTGQRTSVDTACVKQCIHRRGYWNQQQALRRRGM